MTVYLTELCRPSHVALWHKTDIESLALNVHFQGNSGHVPLIL